MDVHAAPPWKRRCARLGVDPHEESQRAQDSAAPPPHIRLKYASLVDDLMPSKADDASVPMAPTPATEGVDHNGLVVGKWKSGLFSSCYTVCVPNGEQPAGRGG
ncbi:unnamed protein product [Phytophthora fragariaefolia]|uniref:Unnamed protein product n=1 Tax=Phytophthora fragariaefolia TaxID=1490495 RepID=A0A9W6XEW5_9STRA|nr:unnamed protein product [Phytophthora fragariaefolia]